MTLEELILTLQQDGLERHQADKVVVRLRDSSVGPVASAEITGIGVGFDWDKGKVFLQTETPIVRQSENQALWQSVRDFLFMLSGETRHYKGEERLTPLAKHIREIFKRHDIRPRKIGTFMPEDTE